MGGTGQATVTQRPPGCPELVLEPGSDFILGCQKINPKWRETKERATSTPAPHPNRGPKAKSSHETKAKVQRKKESRSLTGWSVFRASAGRRDGGASKQTGPGLSLFVVITFCTSSRRSITSQAGRSPLSVLPSLCPSVRLSARAGRQRKSVGLSGVCGLVSVSIGVLLAPFLTLSPMPLNEILLLVVAAGLAAFCVDDGRVGVRGVIGALGLVGQVGTWGGGRGDSVTEEPCWLGNGGERSPLGLA